MAVNAEIERYVVEEILRGRSKRVDPDESLINTGVLDSLSWLQLIGFIEKQFGIGVEDEELAPENFESVNAISAFVERKLAGARR